MTVEPEAAVIGMSVLVSVVAAVRGTWSPCGLSMITSINPMSERARGHRYGLTVLWFVAGSTLGGVLLGTGGALVGLVQGLLTSATGAMAVAVVAAMVSAANDSRLLPWPLPVHPRQVNERWLIRFRRWVYAAGFGLQIGLGFATYIMTAAVYLTAMLAATLTVITGSLSAGILLGAVFGFVRGATVLLSGKADDPIRLSMVHQRLDQLEPWSRRAAIAAALVAAGGISWAAFGAVGGIIVATTVILGATMVARRRSDGGAGACANEQVVARAGRHG